MAPAVTLTAAAYNIRRSGDLDDDAQEAIVIAKYALSKRNLYATVGAARTGSVVTATQVDLAQNYVAVGSDSAKRFTTGMQHFF